MMRRAARKMARLAAASVIVLALAPCGRAQTVERDPDIRPATEFLSEALRREQADLAINRGSLWVDQGAHVWTATPPSHNSEATAAKSCAGCHGALSDAMKGVAARYPSIDRESGQLHNLETRINDCRTRRQHAPAYGYESDDLLALTAAIAVQSRGLAMSVKVDGAAAVHFETGRQWFHQRQGQLNVACSQCHSDNVGRKLRGDTISSGIGTGYPAYRLEWNGLGSLHRRLRACQIGVRAIDLAAGSPEHLALELYLAWRARGQVVETPAIRR